MSNLRKKKKIVKARVWIVYNYSSEIFSKKNHIPLPPLAKNP